MITINDIRVYQVNPENKAKMDYTLNDAVYTSLF